MELTREMFADRQDAGRRLAERLGPYADSDVGSSPGPVVVGLPRGGVVVAAEVARELRAPLDIVVVRKLGCPWQPELGIGAIAEGDIRVLNGDLVRELGLSAGEVDAVAASERAELERRVATYREGRPRESVRGRLVIVIDDGLATGYTARAAIASLRAEGAGRVILAIPVAPDSTAAELRSVADHLVVAEPAKHLLAVGAFYADFRQTSDAEVIELVRAAARARAGAAPPG
ncbi:MAG: phosphoribosyltransferase family protein [Candidatus Limnocylindrales bacterium]